MDNEKEQDKFQLDEWPLPWRFDTDWTDEIYDADGKCVAKVMRPAGMARDIAGNGANVIVCTVNELNSLLKSKNDLIEILQLEINLLKKDLIK